MLFVVLLAQWLLIKIKAHLVSNFVVMATRVGRGRI